MNAKPSVVLDIVRSQEIKCNLIKYSTNTKRINMDNLNSLFSEVKEIIIKTMKSIPAPDKSIYACGFWLFYCDYSSLGIPVFAYNSEEDLDDEDRWSPPEWDVDVEDDMIDALEDVYSRINKKMNGKSDDDWRILIQLQQKVYSDLCLSLNDSKNEDTFPLKHWNLSEEFVIGIFEERECSDLYIELIENSVGEKRAISLGILENC